MMRTAMVVAAAMALCAAARAADETPGPTWQWAVPVELAGDKKTTAMVWVPPSAKRVRGVLIGGMGALTNDAGVRKACESESLAIVHAGIDSIFNYKTGQGPETFQAVLKAAAEATGYREIEVAPFFVFGHSVGTNYATSAACWQPRRCFGTVPFKGGLVYPPGCDPNADLSGVPVLIISGQFEEFGGGPSGVLRDYEDRDSGWRGGRLAYLGMRARNERMLISFAVEAGTTHMAWSPRDGELVGLFIRKAAGARIPDWPVDAKEPVKCKEIDLASGALTSTAITNPAAPKPALYKDYPDSIQTPRKATWWHVDLEMAQAWHAFHAGRFGKRTQYVTFADPATGKALYSKHDLRFDAKAKWVGADTFQVAGTFLLEVRDKYPAPEPPISHASGPVGFRLFSLGGSGAVEQVGPDTFRVTAGSAKGGASAAITAYHDGNETFRYAEQPARLKLDANVKGKAQTVTFPPIGDLKAGGEAKLAATADSGLPVRYAVNHGPAVVRDGKLVICGIPPRAKLPLSVKVTACQWGSSVEPFVQTAEPVSQTVAVKE
jgi:hypothetical protein